VVNHLCLVQTHHGGPFNPSEASSKPLDQTIIEPALEIDQKCVSSVVTRIGDVEVEGLVRATPDGIG